MEVIARELIMLETPSGKVPFEEWIDGIKDKTFQSAVHARLARVEDGLVTISQLVKEYLSFEYPKGQV